MFVCLLLLLLCIRTDRTTTSTSKRSCGSHTRKQNDRQQNKRAQGGPETQREQKNAGHTRPASCHRRYPSENTHQKPSSWSVAVGHKTKHRAPIPGHTILYRTAQAACSVGALDVCVRYARNEKYVTAHFSVHVIYTVLYTNLHSHAQNTGRPPAKKKTESFFFFVAPTSCPVGRNNKRKQTRPTNRTLPDSCARAVLILRGVMMRAPPNKTLQRTSTYNMIQQYTQKKKRLPNLLFSKPNPGETPLNKPPANLKEEPQIETRPLLNVTHAHTHAHKHNRKYADTHPSWHHYSALNKSNPAAGFGPIHISIPLSPPPPLSPIIKSS